MTVVARVGDLAPGEVRAVVAGGVEIALVRTADGEYHAIKDMCSHGRVALSDGDVVGRTLECWKHGSAFDLATGKPTSLPATRPVPVYPVTIDGEDVVVDVETSETPTA